MSRLVRGSASKEWPELDKGKKLGDAAPTSVIYI